MNKNNHSEDVMLFLYTQQIANNGSLYLSVRVVIYYDKCKQCVDFRKTGLENNKMDVGIVKVVIHSCLIRSMAIQCYKLNNKTVAIAIYCPD